MLAWTFVDETIGFSKSKMEAVCRNKLNVAKQTQTSKWHNLGCSCLEGMFQRSSVCCCTFLFLPLSCACQWNAFMLIFILCEFYISSGGWEGKTFHLGNAPNFCTHPNLWFHPPQKLGEFTCLKQSIFLERPSHAKHFWKAPENCGLNDRSNREGFDTCPCLPVREKTVSRFHFQMHWCFLECASCSIFKFVFCLCVGCAKFEIVCDTCGNWEVTYSRVGFGVLFLFTYTLLCEMFLQMWGVQVSL